MRIQTNCIDATKHWDSIARCYVEHSGGEAALSAMETFGELGPKGDSGPAGYYDNDNVPVAERLVIHANKFHIGGDQLTADWFTGKRHTIDLTHALPDRMLAAIRDLPGFVYLGSPYSLYQGGHDEAARVVASYAAALMASGMRVYSPIAHGHFVTSHGKLPLSWEFWKEQCQPMIDAASSLFVLTMGGWRESVGLAYEIEEFSRAGKPIVYVSPVASMERTAA